MHSDQSAAADLHSIVSQSRTIDRSVQQPDSPSDSIEPANPPTTADPNSPPNHVALAPPEPLQIQPPPTTVSKSLTLRLFTSHFLSTWNSRLFEAGVVYFLASAFPNNLLPISVYALARNAAAIALTVPVGNWIDRANRLTVVRASIVGQRVAVTASCGIFWVMLAPQSKGALSGRVLDGLFAATVVLACVEKLCAGVNLVAVERDWVVVITEGDEVARRMMNARMRRIDLFCKLLGPLTVAFIAAASVPVAVYSTLGMNVASVLVEYLCIETVCSWKRVYRRMC
jgi:iron-regulated transporter 1